MSNSDIDRKFFDYLFQGRDELERLVPERFAFLIERYGFSPGPVKKAFGDTRTYFTRDIDHVAVAIEVNINFSSGLMNVCLVRLENGNPPEHPMALMIERGERVRIALIYLLRDILSIQDTLLDDFYDYLIITKGSRRQVSAETLTRWSDMLKQYIEFLLKQPVDALLPSLERIHTQNI